MSAPQIFGLQFVFSLVLNSLLADGTSPPASRRSRYGRR